MIWLIWPDERSISLIAETALRTTPPLLSASERAEPIAELTSAAPSAVRRTVAVIWSSDAAVSSSVAAWCSVRWDRSSAAWLICSAPTIIPSALPTITVIASCSWSIAPLKSSWS